jgi:predicted nucleic acid-binding protein
MKWQHGLAILVSVIIAYLLWQNWTKNQLINQLQTQSLTREVDTLTKETEVKVIQWKTKKVLADKIVNKWHNVHDTIIKRDTLLIECQKDIFSLDTALYSCELALTSCLNLKTAQNNLIKNLENRKTPMIVPYVGVGLSMDKNLLVSPAVQCGVGLNINKIFGKK